MRLLLALLLFACGGSPAAAEDAPPEGIEAPPEGFAKLFNGKDLAGWRGLVAGPPKVAAMSEDELAKAQVAANERMKQHWSVEDGVLVYDGKGNSLATEKDFQNFELILDWKIREAGDSGIYLRGSPQVQIWDPSKWNGVGSGGLYNNKKNPSEPTKVADKPIGEWNTFRIRMVGETVWVWLNGELVVPGVVLENYWERNKPIYETGAIELQHHGNRLEFRNIFIKELPANAKAADYEDAKAPGL